MNGAANLCKFFPNKEQFGKILVVPNSHARGKTFRIYVLPKGVNATNLPDIPTDAVEVYGVVGGHPGWSESYGWLHCGPWEADFVMEHQKRAESETQRLAAKRLIKDSDNAVQEALRVKELLEKY